MKKERDSITEDKWMSGIEAELDFWRRFLTNLKPDYFRLNPNMQLQPFVTSTLTSETSQKDSLDILELGSGPLCGIGKKWGDKKLNLVAVDPLGEEYTKLLDEAGIKPLVPLTKGKGEDLLKIFGDQPLFDYIHCANALDHSLDPALIIENMLALARQGATVNFSVYQNEGKHNNYNGLHQWNFDIFHEKIVIWNNDSIYFLEEVTGENVYTISTSPYEVRVNISVDIVKRKSN